MKIIAKVDRKNYIAEIDHYEIEKFLGLYYDKMAEIHVGDTIDLSKGYNHAQEIKDAMKKTQDLISGNQKVVEAILNGMQIVTIMGKQEVVA